MEFHNYYRQIKKISLVEFHDIDNISYRLYNRPIESWFSTKQEGSYDNHIYRALFYFLKRENQEYSQGSDTKNAFSHNKIICYLGGRGDFDELCATACRELKKERGDIELIYVTPYISLSEQSKIRYNEEQGLYDSSIYPPIESTPPRFAISKRNEWMILNSDLVIAYVIRSYGGAYKSLQVAKKRNKRIINICSLI